jgi:hypothetical protein
LPPYDKRGGNTLAGTTTLFACMDWRHLLEIVSAIRARGRELLNLCVWVKTNGGMGSLYRSRHELVFVFGERDETRVDNVERS